jgi:hypothetical protein
MLERVVRAAGGGTIGGGAGDDSAGPWAVGIGPYYYKMAARQLPEIESYLNKIKSCNLERLEIESY